MGSACGPPAAGVEASEPTLTSVLTRPQQLQLSAVCLLAFLHQACFPHHAARRMFVTETKVDEAQPSFHWHDAFERVREEGTQLMLAGGEPDAGLVVHKIGWLACVGVPWMAASVPAAHLPSLSPDGAEAGSRACAFPPQGRACTMRRARPSESRMKSEQEGWGYAQKECERRGACRGRGAACTQLAQANLYKEQGWRTMATQAHTPSKTGGGGEWGRVFFVRWRTG